MLETSLKAIQETEERMEAEKAAARVEAERMVSFAEKTAKENAVKAKEELLAERTALLQKAEEAAAKERETILHDAETASRELRAKAAEHLDAAVAQILSKGV